jgi:hypothetical protein
MSDPDLLAQRLAEIRARHPGSQPEMVAEVVRVVLSTLSGDLSAQETSLLAEVEALCGLDRRTAPGASTLRVGRATTARRITRRA